VTGREKQLVGAAVATGLLIKDFPSYVMDTMN
jgi:hypothetical protein